MSPDSYLFPKGRVSRADYWLKFYLPYMGIYFLAFALDAFVFGTFDEESGLGIISGIVMILGIWPSIAISIKRLHDRNKSWWYLLIGIIPIVNIWISIEMSFLGGTEGNNDFGSDPRGSPWASTESLA